MEEYKEYLAWLEGEDFTMGCKGLLPRIGVALVLIPFLTLVTLLATVWSIVKVILIFPPLVGMTWIKILSDNLGGKK